MNWLSLFQILLPLAAAGLLAGTIAQGIWRVFDSRNGAKHAEPWNKQATLNAGLLMCAVCAAGVAFFVLTALDADVGSGETLETALRTVFPTSIDADHYLQLAQYGYGADQQAPEFAGQHLMIVFFPLFPWLVRLVCALTGLGYYTAGLLIQPVLFGIGCAALYRLVQPRFGCDVAGRTLLLLCLLPGSFFFAAPMTESLFLALTMLAFVWLDRDRPLGFALLGFAAALARSAGGLLAGVAWVVWLQRLVHRHAAAANDGCSPWRWLAAGLGPAAGTGCYLVLNWYYYGDPFAFAVVQKSHWNQGLGWVGNTVRYMLSYLVEWWNSNRNFALYVALLTVVLILAKAVVLAANSRILPVPWLAYSVAYLLFTDGAAWLLSCARYTLALPFFPLGLALCCKKKWQQVALALALGVVWLLYLRKYLAYGPIY